MLLEVLYKNFKIDKFDKGIKHVMDLKDSWIIIRRLKSVDANQDAAIHGSQGLAYHPKDKSKITAGFLYTSSPRSVWHFILVSKHK